MGGEFQERRRFPRVETVGGCEFRTGRRTRVRLLDISATGVLLATNEPLPVGTTGRLQVTLGPLPFEAVVQVTREEAAKDGRGRVAGVSIVSAQHVHRDALEEFLRRAGA